jgi:spore maturation protein CgeB
MRIFYASGERPNQALPGSQVWRNNLYLSLVDLGHDVVEFQFDLNPLLRHADVANPEHRAFVNEHRPRAEAALLEQLEVAHREAPVDLLFSYFYSVCARPETIRSIRAMGIRTMNWYCNGSYQFNLVEEIAPAYDWCLVPEAFRMDDYRRVGANPIYCQEAANPQIYHPVQIERDLDVVFVGARYGERPAYIRRLVDAGVPVRVFGPGWQQAARPAPVASHQPMRADPGSRPGRRLIDRFRGLLSPAGVRRLARRARRAVGSGQTAVSRPPAALAQHAAASLVKNGVSLPPEVCGPSLSDDEMVAMYSRAKVSLGFSSVGATHEGPERIVQVRLRDFEAPMSGAFYLVEDVPELAQFFEIGSEIACYSGPDDLVEKCRYYLANESERERIRVAGHARALRDHTWQRRLRDVFRTVGLPETGELAELGGD